MTGTALRRRRLSPEAALLIAATVLYLVISTWWALADDGLPNTDHAKHAEIALRFRDAIAGGSLAFPLTEWTSYPPLVHLVGALGMLVGGRSLAAATIAENVVFLPLLALGCYGAGRVAFGRRVGLLAALFALATPMLMSLFHVFMLDAPATALAAGAVWLLLESDRFSRLRPSVLAGVAVAAGFHVKGTFVLVVAGLVLALLVRGGWRNRTGALAFAGVALLLILPWHLAHLGDLLSQTEGATDGRALVWYGSETYPSRWSLANFTWYGWAAVNTQLYLPLTLFVAGGGLFAVWRLARGRERETYLPELLAGGIVAYVSISLINLDDPRYTLPALVYAAVLGTWWIARVGRRAALVAAAVLCVLLVANTVIHDAGIGDPVRIDLPGAQDDPIARGSVTLVSGAGYVEGAPRRDGIRSELQGLLERAHRDGARRAVFDLSTMGPAAGFNAGQLRVLGRLAGLRITPLDTPTLPAPEPGDVLVTRLPVRDAGRPPCVPAGAGFGIYLQDGPGAAPRCPAP